MSVCGRVSLTSIGGQHRSLSGGPFNRRQRDDLDKFRNEIQNDNPGGCVKANSAQKQEGWLAATT